LTASLTLSWRSKSFYGDGLQDVRNISPFHTAYRQVSEHKKSAPAKRSAPPFPIASSFLPQVSSLALSALKYFSSGKGYLRPVIEKHAIN
jgi:hypothetical protein